MAKKSKGNRLLVKLYNDETGEFKVKPFNRKVIDIATYTANMYSPKLRKHIVFKAKKLK
jgi:hypothetical protein